MPAQLPAPRKAADYTAFARLLERWMKSKPGIMPYHEFAEIVGLSDASISEVFSKGKQLSDPSIRKIAEGTREYDLAYTPEVGYEFGQPGIPLDMLMEARLAAKPDEYSYIYGYIANQPNINDDERRRLLQMIGDAHSAYTAGKLVETATQTAAKPTKSA